MVPEIILTALGSALAGGAYMRWRVKPELQDLDRWRAVSSLKDVAATGAEHVVRLLGTCPACHNTTFKQPPCACSRKHSHVHVKCDNCQYQWIVDPLDPNAK
jgi:hypothetical protein